MDNRHCSGIIHCTEEDRQPETKKHEDRFREVNAVFQSSPQVRWTGRVNCPRQTAVLLRYSSLLCWRRRHCMPITTSRQLAANYDETWRSQDVVLGLLKRGSVVLWCTISRFSQEYTVTKPSIKQLFPKKRKCLNSPHFFLLFIMKFLALCP